MHDMPSRYDASTRAKAIRLVREHAEDYPTEWAAITAVAGRLGMSAEALRKADASAMRPYAGQLMTNGAQAQAYADHFIAVHLREMAGGKTYAQLSAQSLAQPKNTQLAGLVQTVFRGTTLRGLLLNAYAFWKMGQIMLTAAIVAFVAAGFLLILSILGYAHVRWAKPDEEVFPKIVTTAQVTAS